MPQIRKEKPKGYNNWTTCNQLDLETLGSWPILPKNLADKLMEFVCWKSVLKKHSQLEAWAHMAGTQSHQINADGYSHFWNLSGFFCSQSQSITLLFYDKAGFQLQECSRKLWRINCTNNNFNSKHQVGLKLTHTSLGPNFFFLTWRTRRRTLFYRAWIIACVGTKIDVFQLCRGSW